MTIPGADIFRCAASILARALRPSNADRLTLDLLRSNLSHETSAKMARLAGLFAEWSQGRYRPEDPGDIQEILRNLREIFLGHARLAAVAPVDSLRLIRVLTSLRRISRLIRPAVRRSELSSEALRKIDRELLRLRERTRLFVDGLSGRYGKRIAEVLTESVDEIRREIGGGLTPGTVTILVENRAGSGSGWIQRSEAPYWSDLFRNLVRNAVDATKDRMGAESTDPPPVVVRLLPLVAKTGTTIEIHDRGLGMTPDEIDRVWISGHGRHGQGRGLGLTESKRAFIQSRGDLIVTSRPGEGTTLRIDLPFRDVTVPPVTSWNLLPVYAPFAVAIVAALAILLGPRQHVELQSVWAPTGTSVQALGRDDRPLWTREFGEMVLRNDAAGDLVHAEELNSRDAPLILRDGSGRPEAVIVATRPGDGPGHLWSIQADNSSVAKHTLAWCTSVGLQPGQLQSTWQSAMDWPGIAGPAFIAHLRAANYSDTATEFFTADFESLGAYYHHGHLTVRLATDLDGNGRTDILLVGVNNSAAGDTTIFPRRQSVFIDCLALLEAPDVGGQSYPATNWPGMERAREKGYLLFPPLVEGTRPIIRRIDLADAGRDDGVRFDVVLEDGRMYRLDEQLRPLSCGTGDHTLARRLAPTRPVGRLAYWCRGHRELIDLPVR